MKIRAHFEELHKTLGESHETQAQHHATLAECYAKLAGQVLKVAQQDDAAAHLTAIAEAHLKMHGHHSEQAALHQALAEECQKVEGTELKRSGNDEMELLTKLIDARVEEAIGNTVAPPPMSRIAPNAPATSMLVPRPGSPTPAQKVPLEFAKLIAIDEDEG